MWAVTTNVTSVKILWMSCMLHASYHVMFSRDDFELTDEDMNKLKYDYILGGYSV